MPDTPPAAAPSEQPRRRPPWWPEDEPWPPQGRWRTRRGPPAFIRRYFFLFALAVFGFMFLAVGGATLLFWLLATGLGPPSTFAGPPPFVRVGAVVALAIIIMLLAQIFRAVRRAATPVSELLDGVERIADGDFAVRIRERGPRATRNLARAFNSMAGRLEDNEHHRRALLADVTHELRTPLTVIQGSLEGFLDGVYPADPAHLAPILEETHVLSRLIDDLRTLSLAESGTLALHREPTDLGVLAGETAAAFRPQAETAGVTVNLDVSDDLPLLSVDPVRLSEVMHNLVSNALRYTPAGGTVTLTGRPAEDGGAVLEVRDTGTGIATDALPHVFDRFYKSADSRGSGLGLAIAKNLITAHGGQLSVESELGKGTLMRVKLPGE